MTLSLKFHTTSNKILGMKDPLLLENSKSSCETELEKPIIFPQFLFPQFQLLISNPLMFEIKGKSTQLCLYIKNYG